jgi:tRNA nucleotidyltransferase (CCA-adding enzyme)
MTPTISTEQLNAARERDVPPALVTALEAADLQAYLVGGAVRDALLKHEPDGPDIDVAVEGDIGPLLDRLGVEHSSHERFGTAKVLLAGHAIDLARTRREIYEAPGALPEVAPAPIRTDLARRDFTINAMAIPLRGAASLIDPYDGLADLESRVLRAIHPESFVDDPTRALRGARYAARLELTPEPETRALLAATDLGSVSADRISADLLRIGAEPEAVRAFTLLDQWGILALGPERLHLLAEAAEYLQTEPWSRLVDRAALLVTIATADPALLRAAATLAEQSPDEPAAQLFELASHHNDLELAIARAMGADWLDRHVSEWRRVELTIDGQALIAAGVDEGPDVGRGLRAALHARLEGRIAASPDEELAIALAEVEAT